MDDEEKYAIIHNNYELNKILKYHLRWKVSDVFSILVDDNPRSLLRSRPFAFKYSRGNEDRDKLLLSIKNSRTYTDNEKRLLSKYVRNGVKYNHYNVDLECWIKAYYCTNSNVRKVTDYKEIDKFNTVYTYDKIISDLKRHNNYKSYKKLVVAQFYNCTRPSVDGEYLLYDSINANMYFQRNYFMHEGFGERKTIIISKLPRNWWEEDGPFFVEDRFRIVGWRPIHK